jgi:DNA-binding response OmpR family regulator
VRLVRTGKDSPNPFVPIIMLTGHTEMHRVIEARDAGVHEFLAKPISAKGLYSRVKSIIERPRPFIRAGLYFGPDRRRRQIDWKGPERRKTSTDLISTAKPAEETPAEDEGGLSQAEVEALLNG